MEPTPPEETPEEVPAGYELQPLRVLTQQAQMIESLSQEQETPHTPLFQQQGKPKKKRNWIKLLLYPLGSLLDVMDLPTYEKYLIKTKRKSLLCFLDILLVVLVPVLFCFVWFPALVRSGIPTKQVGWTVAIGIGGWVVVVFLIVVWYIYKSAIGNFTSSFLVFPPPPSIRWSLTANKVAVFSLIAEFWQHLAPAFDPRVPWPWSNPGESSDIAQEESAGESTSSGDTNAVSQLFQAGLLAFEGASGWKITMIVVFVLVGVWTCITVVWWHPRLGKLHKKLIGLGPVWKVAVPMLSGPAFMPIVRNLFGALSCTYHSSPALDAASSIACWSGPHTGWAFGAMLCLFLYFPSTSLLPPGTYEETQKKGGSDIQFTPAFLLFANVVKCMMMCMGVFFSTVGITVPVLTSAVANWMLAWLVAWLQPSCFVGINLWRGAAFFLSGWAGICALIAIGAKDASSEGASWAAGLLFGGALLSIVLTAALHHRAMRGSFESRMIRTLKKLGCTHISPRLVLEGGQVVDRRLRELSSEQQVIATVSPPSPSPSRCDPCSRVVFARGLEPLIGAMLSESEADQALALSFSLELIDLLDNTSDINVQRQCTWALAVLIAQSGAKMNEDDQQRAGCACVQVLKTATDIPVQRHCSSAIAALGSMESNRKVLVEAGAKPPLQAIVEDAKDVRVKKEATAALKFLNQYVPGRKWPFQKEQFPFPATATDFLDSTDGEYRCVVCGVHGKEEQMFKHLEDENHVSLVKQVHSKMRSCLPEASTHINEEYGISLDEIQYLQLQQQQMQQFQMQQQVPFQMQQQVPPPMQQQVIQPQMQQQLMQQQVPIEMQKLQQQMPPEPPPMQQQVIQPQMQQHMPFQMQQQMPVQMQQQMPVQMQQQMPVQMYEPQMQQIRQLPKPCSCPTCMSRRSKAKVPSDVRWKRFLVIAFPLPESDVECEVPMPARDWNEIQEPEPPSAPSGPPVPYELNPLRNMAMQVAMVQDFSMR